MENKERKLVLNTKNTLYISLAFFSILMFWQIYNLYGTYFIDAMLAEVYEERYERAYIVGIIMALDNFFALFMLPIFGVLSDKTTSKYGRRIPYIVLGMFFAALVFPLIAVAYLINSLAGVVIMMLLVLIIMNIYRNPAIALMPDVTPKPLRSKANGIINLIAYIGAILASALFFIFGVDGGILSNQFDSIPNNDLFSLVPFLIVSGIMLVAMIVLFIKVKENQLVEAAKEDMEYGEKLSLTIEEIQEDVPLSKEDKRNMILLLFAVFFWFAAFNAIETFISVYSEEVFGDEFWAGLITAILVVFAILSFIPAAILASKIGRKYTITIGLVALVVGFLLAYLINQIHFVFFLGIAIAGIGWALINVNSYPMMVEMSHKNNVGKYTGYYYTSSMLAQSFTPVIAGLVILINKVYDVLLPYAIVLSIASLLVFIFISENKEAVKNIKKGIDVFDVDID